MVRAKSKKERDTGVDAETGAIDAKAAVAYLKAVDADFKELSNTLAQIARWPNKTGKAFSAQYSPGMSIIRKALSEARQQAQNEAEHQAAQAKVRAEREKDRA